MLPLQISLSKKYIAYHESSKFTAYMHFKMSKVMLIFTFLVMKVPQSAIGGIAERNIGLDESPTGFQYGPIFTDDFFVSNNNV